MEIKEMVDREFEHEEAKRATRKTASMTLELSKTVKTVPLGQMGFQKRKYEQID